MRLNQLKPSRGSRKTRQRVGRGMSSGRGKTAGRGHKGQNSRSGGGVRPGFEGGQLPLYKRIPMYGFRSRKAKLTAEVRLSELSKIDGDVVDLNSLKQAGILPRRIMRARVIDSGELDGKVKVDGLHLTKGAKKLLGGASESKEDE